VNAGPKKPLGVSESLHGAAESRSKLDNIFRRTIGQTVFALVHTNSSGLISGAQKRCQKRCQTFIYCIYLSR